MNKRFLSNGKDIFKSRVIAVVKEIPRGTTMSYSEVAKRALHPKAARAVGAIMSANKDKTIPCHRVIRADGTIGGYNGLQGISDKAALLRKEGALK